MRAPMHLSFWLFFFKTNWKSSENWKKNRKFLVNSDWIGCCCISPNNVSNIPIIPKILTQRGCCLIHMGYIVTTSLLCSFIYLHCIISRMLTLPIIYQFVFCLFSNNFRSFVTEVLEQQAETDMMFLAPWGEKEQTQDTKHITFE